MKVTSLGRIIFIASIAAAGCSKLADAPPPAPSSEAKPAAAAPPATGATAALSCA